MQSAIKGNNVSRRTEGEFVDIKLDASITAHDLRCLEPVGLGIRSVDGVLHIVRNRPARPVARGYQREIFFPAEKRIEVWPTTVAVKARLLELRETHQTSFTDEDYIRWFEREGSTVVPCGGTDVEFTP